MYTGLAAVAIRSAVSDAFSVVAVFAIAVADPFTVLANPSAVADAFVLLPLLLFLLLFSANYLSSPEAVRSC